MNSPLLQRPRSNSWASSVNQKDGIYSWTVGFGLFLVNCIDDGILKAFGVLLNPLSLQYDVDIWVIGSTLALMGFVGNITAMVASPIIKQMQSRHMMMAFGFITCFGLVLASIAETWTMFSLGIVLISGIGQRCSALVTFSILQDYFDKRFGLASALLNAGRPIGTLTFAPLTQLLLYSYGTKGTVLLLSAMSFNISLVGAIIKPRRKQIEHKKIDQEDTERLGCFPQLLESFQLDLYKNPAFLSLLATGFANVYGFQAWVIYLVPNAIQKGLSPFDSTLLATVGGVGQLTGLAVSGFAIDADVIPANMVCLLALISSGITFAVNLWSNTFLSLGFNSFLFGCGIASISVGICARVNAISKGGNSTTIFSNLFIFGAMARLISGSVTGWFYDQTGSYNASFLIVSGVQFGAAIILAVEMAYYYVH